jgi:hypothetical protein
MTSTYDEGRLRFTFDGDCVVLKYDEWLFYRTQFGPLADAHMSCSHCEAHLQCAACQAARVAGTKGVDFVCLHQKVVWFVEVKDYRQTRTHNLEFLADEVALKVRDSLAALTAARWQANDEGDRQLARQLLGAKTLRVVLHLEQPLLRSTLAPSANTRRAHVLDRLKRLVKKWADPQPRVIHLELSSGLPWKVANLPRTKS